MAEESTPGDVTSIGASPTFLTVAEVATTLRVSKMSVYRLIHNGSLESVRFGRSFRVTQDALDVYLKESFYQTG
jgi:excisionase family DNA binding protein